MTENELEIIRQFRKTWVISGDSGRYQPIPESIESLEEIVEFAIDKSYFAASNRALKITDSNQPEYVKCEQRKSAALANGKCRAILRWDILELLNNKVFNREAFSKWEEGVATHLRRVYVGEFGVSDFTYGNAQKWINVAIKYVLSSSNLPSEVDELFFTAYFPIDRIVIGCARKQLGVKKPNASWSQLDDWSEIKKYQDAVHDAAQKKGLGSSLLWEIGAWRR